MKNSLTFEKALRDLERLVDLIEDDKIQLDDLTDQVKRANNLIQFCETKLKGINKKLDRTKKR